MNTLPWQPMKPARMIHKQVSGVPEYWVSGNEQSLGHHGGVVAVMGVFDGLHRGHEYLIREAVTHARRQHIPCVGVTFDPDPSEVLNAESLPERLLPTQDRVSCMLALGLDAVVTFSFTRAFANLSPQVFLDEALCGVLAPCRIYVGENFRFGAAGAGDVQGLAEYGKTHGFDVATKELLRDQGEVVSATHVRKLLRAARLDEANALLGRCHYVRGRVEHGRGEGTGFGFPTANVRCDRHACLPAEGVYAAYVANGHEAWPAAVNVGAPPTFASPDPAFLEANLLGFSGDLYDAEVTVSFVSWLRPSRTFESLDELRRVVLGNIDWVREHLGECGVTI